MGDFIDDPEEIILIIACVAGGIGLIAYGFFISSIHFIIFGFVVLAFGILFIIIVLVFG